LVFDFCSAFPLDKSLLTAGLQRMYAALPFLTGFLISRAVSPSAWFGAPQATSEGQKLFRSLCGSSVAE
jgi:hypothetical protein